MKKLYVPFLFAMALTACNNETKIFEPELSNALATSTFMDATIDMEYKPIKSTILRKITAKEMIDSVGFEVELVTKKLYSTMQLDTITKEGLTAMRNQENDFRSSLTSNYIEEYVFGPGDKSQFVLDMKANIELTDSLLQDIDGAKEEKLHLVKAVTWYKRRSAKYWKAEKLEAIYKGMLNEANNAISQKQELKKYESLPNDQVVFTFVNHEYSIKNPLSGQSMKMKKDFVFNKENKILKNE